MPTITYELPNEIDGPAEHVQHETLTQLEALAPAVEELLRQTETQLRGAWLTFELNREPELTPAELEARWELSPQRRLTRNLRASGRMIARETRELSKRTRGR